MSQPPPLPKDDHVEIQSGPPPIPSHEGQASGKVLAEYEARITAFDKVSNYVLTASDLRVQNEYGERVVPLTEIVEVRCRFFPTRVQRNRYETILTLRNGATIKLCNQFFRGMADFEDRSSSYKPFIRALHQQLANRQPGCRYFAGTTTVKFWLNALFLGVVLLLLLVLGIIMIASVPLIAIVKLVIILFYLPTAVKWFKRNKPREYQSGGIPKEVMP